MDNVLGQDLISDLPQSIIETILTKLPIRDAVRTFSLSSKWRYIWANLTQLVFDDNCATLCNDKGAVEDSLAKFITRFLFLHDGPIHKFSLIVNSPCLQELQISGSSNISTATEAPDLDF
ncbi:hypothetical protein HYC85_020422 [Camellia sinensis]|uniref:F-box domain-containing protein n=1 Tax=Camellia sinensis TaxID=4442 RepID=A0A7J7GPZ9_CAMSI|nr:hypothetical protein HYC85_020422 [Camellia sinensis]